VVEELKWYIRVRKGKAPESTGGRDREERTEGDGSFSSKTIFEVAGILEEARPLHCAGEKQSKCPGDGASRRG